MSDDALEIESEPSEIEQETARRQALVLAVDHLRDAVKSLDIGRIKQSILIALAKIESSTAPGCYVDSMSVVASALWFLESEDVVDVEEVHPYCDGGAPYVAFASVAVVLDHASSLSAAMDTGAELFGADSHSLEVAKKLMVDELVRGEKLS